MPQTLTGGGMVDGLAHVGVVGGMKGVRDGEGRIRCGSGCGGWVWEYQMFRTCGIHATQKQVGRLAMSGGLISERWMWKKWRVVQPWDNRIQVKPSFGQARRIWSGRPNGRTMSIEPNER